MNGIAGIVYPDIFQVNHLINPMLNILKHRGGDLKDTHLYKNIQIGICGQKLSTNEKKNIFCAYDGFIEYPMQLREELKRHGCQAPLQNIGEILICAYEFWGPTFIEKVNGEFAIAMLDQHKERVFIVRDRIGKKPLYWFNDQHHFIFASELKSILATGAVPHTPAKDALASYLYFGYIPQDMSPIKDVNKLLPAHYLLFNKDRSLLIQPYWSYSSFFTQPNFLHKNTLVKKLDQMVLSSVKVRIPERERIGCFVSGGLGSAAIAYYVHKLAGGSQVKAYSVGFQGENDEDIRAAQEVAKSLQIPQVCDVITPDTFLDHIVPIGWHMDEPLADPNVIATWKQCSLAKQDSEIVFSGMGSDELFAGHTRYTLEGKQLDWKSRLLQLPKPILLQVLIPLLKFVNSSATFTLLKKSRTNPWQFEYLRQNALFNEKQIEEASPLLAGLFDPEVFLHKFHNLSRIRSTVSSFLYFDVKTRLADCFVLQIERLTAAQKLDWRTPFLDRQLFEFLAGLPEPERLVESDTAMFLKAVLQTHFPDSFIERPKKVRTEFLKKWVLLSDLQTIFQKLLTGSLAETGLISRDWLLKHTQTPQSCQKSFKYLWAILALEIWFRLYINRPVYEEAPGIPLRDLLAQQI